MIPLPTSHTQEHEFAKIITGQAIHGFPFDYEKATSLYLSLENRMEEIYTEVRPHLLHEQVRKYAPVLEPKRKDGEFKVNVKNYWGNEVVLVSGAYSPVHWEEPDIGSRNKLMKQLQRYGWKPVNYTEKGNPKLDEESLEGLDLGETGNLLIEYFKAKQRKSTLYNEKSGGWLGNAYTTPCGDYRLDAIANPCGTNTHRCTHSVIVNVPKASPEVYFGEEFRSLFTAPPGWVLFGADASQLEFRCALSYMNATEMIKLVEDPDVDVHQMIYERIKRFMNSRNTTKNVVYGSIYGATPKKLGEIADVIPPGMTKEQVGQEMLTVLLEYIPGLATFKQAVESRAARGYVIGIDGFPVYMRRKEGRILKHTAINTLLQHAGSMVVKRATVTFNKEAKARNLPWHQTAHMHDELQGITKEWAAPELGELFNDSLVAAGKEYGLACAMEGEWQIGPNWASTH